MAKRRANRIVNSRRKWLNTVLLDGQFNVWVTWTIVTDAAVTMPQQKHPAYSANSSSRTPDIAIVRQPHGVCEARNPTVRQFPPRKCNVSGVALQNKMHKWRNVIYQTKTHLRKGGWGELFSLLNQRKEQSGQIFWNAELTRLCRNQKPWVLAWYFLCFR